MRLKVIHSTKKCAESKCPTIYRDEATGNFVIQGFIMKETDKGDMSIPQGEDAVVVPAEFLQEFIEKQKLK